MRLITKINDSAFQSMTLTGNPGQVIELELQYMPSQRQWVMNVEFEDFTANGLLVANSPNIMNSFKNIIPFGFLCVTEDGLDPHSITAFDDGDALLYLLNPGDLAEQEELL